MTRPRRSLLSWLPLEDRITPAVAMLPDLNPDPANLSGWTVSTVGGVTELAYATGMQNIGKGAFELRGTTTIINNPDGTQSQIVDQRIYNDDLTFTDVPAGAFVYHPTHGHVHYDDFAVGRIRTRPTANWEDGSIVAYGPKTSFCLLDLSHNNPQLPGSPANSVYNSCSSKVQGISVGYKDIYSSGLDGQQIDITGLPNGDYWLEVEADPMNHVQETDETNNTTRIPISLTSQPNVGLRVLSSSPIGANNGPVDFIDVNFNLAVNAATFDKSDVVMTGPSGAIPVTGVTPNSSVSYRIHFAPQGQVGTYAANIGPDILGTDGKALNQDNDGTFGEPSDDVFTNIFTITAPRLTATTPSGATSTAVSSVRLQYNKPLDSSTVTFADILSFTGPGGGDLMSQMSGIDPVTPGGTSALFDISFSSMTGLGTYTLVIGEGMADPLGNTIDQNGDLVTDSNDRTTITFTIVPPGTVGPDAFGYSAKTASYEDLSSLTGWTTIINSADDANVAVNLGTNTFNLYGTSYTGGSSVYVNSNGLITFGGGSSSYQNSNLESITYNSTSFTGAALAPLWDDFVKGPGTPQVRGLLQDTSGDSTPDRFLVQWNQVYPYNTSSSGMTFTAILQLNTGATPGSVIYNYQDLNAGNLNFTDGASATVGLRNTQSNGSLLLINQNSNTNDLVTSGVALEAYVPTVKSIVREGAATVDAGDAEFFVTFSDAVTGLDTSDFQLVTTGNIAGAYIDHIHETSDPKVFEVHTKSGVGSGTLTVNFVDNDTVVSLLGAKVGGLGNGNGSFNNAEIYNIVQPTPTVQGLNIGDGTAQRSRVDQVQVVFDNGVIFVGNPADAFVVTGPNGPVTVAVDFSGSAPNQTTAKLLFSGSATEFGSLKDGVYTLTILANKISTGGVNLAGDGTPGSDYTTTFKRLYGDIDGNGTVSSADFALFGASFGQSFGVGGSAFDFNNDGTVDGSTDFARFGSNFGLTI